MEEFQRGLLEDLRGRVASLRERVNAVSDDPDLVVHATVMERALEKLDGQVQRLLLDPSLGLPELNRQHRILYQRYNQSAALYESFLLPALERFSEHDRKLTRLVRKLGEQIKWPMPTPLVVADSMSSYMVLPTFQLMRVPASEDESMLGYPNLVHELTHSLLTKERGRLLGDYVNVLSDYAAQAFEPLGPSQAAQPFIEYWREWIDEFVGDMVATYTCGPAFGYQYIRLISGIPPQAFKYDQTHPPDEARVRGMVAVLRAVGRERDAADVTKLLGEYLPTTIEVKPAGYAQMVPDSLVEELAKRVVEGCKQLDLRAYTSPEVSQPGDIVGMVAEGWRRVRSTPATFVAWQRTRLRLLWSQLGLDHPVVAPRPAATSSSPAHPQPPRSITTGGSELVA